MTSKLLTNPKYWRDRAEEIKAIADRLANQETKRTCKTSLLATNKWRGERRNG
jgi:hypothetical protein